MTSNCIPNPNPNIKLILWPNPKPNPKLILWPNLKP